MFPSLEALISEDIAEAESLRGKLHGFAPAVEKAALLCVEALRNGGKLVLFGNGGSAADAQHIAAEFVGRFELERQPLPAIALTTNTSALTAIGNDYGYDVVFERQVQALVGKNDVVFGFSTSGNSVNVLKGIAAAKSIGAKTIGFSGEGGTLKDNVDVAFAMPTAHTPRIQELHIFFGHVISHAVESMIAGQIAA